MTCIVTKWNGIIKKQKNTNEKMSRHRNWVITRVLINLRKFLSARHYWEKGQMIETWYFIFE